jgi:hypothetical protein
MTISDNLSSTLIKNRKSREAKELLTRRFKQSIIIATPIALGLGFLNLISSVTRQAEVLPQYSPAPYETVKETPVPNSVELVEQENVSNMPAACVRAKVTREECDQAIALYNAQQNQGPTWSGQEFNENQRKAWAQ